MPRPHPLTFAVWQVSKTVPKADDSIEAALWWLGHVFVQSHPVGFLNDWGPGRGDQAGTLVPPIPIATKCSSASVSPQETHRDSTSHTREGIIMDMEGEGEEGPRENEAMIQKEDSVLMGFYFGGRERHYK